MGVKKNKYMSYNHFNNEIEGEEEPSLGKFMLHMGIIGILIAVVYLAFY
jgi:hypothetical protein